MCIKNKFYFFLFGLITFLFCFKLNIYAEGSFTDSFVSLDNWIFIPNRIEDTSSWSVNLDEQLVGEISKTDASFLYSKPNDFTNFVFEYDAENISGVDQEVMFRVTPDKQEYYLINTRFYDPHWTQDKNLNQIILFKYIDGRYFEKKRIDLSSEFNLVLSQNKFYKYKIIANENNIEVYIDDLLVLTYTDLDPILIGGVGFWNHGGQYNYSKTRNIFDNLVITPIGSLTPIPTITPVPTIIPTETPIPTPTETPTPIPTEVPVPKEKKIFILPGLGASWNSEAIVFGNNVNDNQWKMTPFVNNYDGLIELLDNNGLIRDEDYFVWNYDWRRTLEDIETNFDEYVESKNLDENDEIYLVGHSLGGLIARLWASDNINDYEIKEVITLGSPHLGSLDSYSVWNGAEILTNKGISSIAFKILLGLQNKSFLIKDLDKVRSFAPITKDLLPVFDYALKSGKLLSWQNLESKNDNLYNKNQSINDLGTRLSLFVGTGYTTPSVLKLGKRTVFDKALGLWPDGQILSFNTSDGDGTVLKTSAQNNSSVSTVLNSDHGGIVYNSLNYISEKLDLINRNISVEYVDNFSDSLLVFIGSPATGKLICNGQIFEENEGFILASNQDFNNCNLELSPTDNGKVHLVFGNTKNSDWEYLEKDVVKNEIERLEISASSGKIVLSKNNKNFLLSMIKNDLKTLGLNKAIQSLDKNDYIKVLAYVFKYRETHDEKIISQRILDNLLIISTINNSDRKRFDYKLVEKYIKLIEAVISLKYRVKPLPSDNAVAFEVLKNFGQEVKVLVKNRTYPNFWIANTLLAGYSKEVLSF